MEYSELNQLLQSLKIKEKTETEPSKDEKNNSKVVMKSVYARNYIKKGEIFSLKNLAIKRPCNKKQPYQLWSLLGKKSKKNYQADQAI